MMTYEQFAQLPASEKVVFCKVNAVDQFKVWTSEPDLFQTYSKSVPHWVKSVKVNGLLLNESDSKILSPNEFHFDAKNKKLYIRIEDGVAPKTKQIIVTYTFYFSTKSLNLPNDFYNGSKEYVEWDGRIEGIGQIGQQLDEENTGVVLESSSTVNLINKDGFFDDIIDTLIWENQAIEFYSWSPLIPLNMAVKLFSGVIESKSPDADKVTFKVKDFVYRLQNQVRLPLFSETDGNVSPSMIGKPKRRIYGKARQVQTTGIDQILGGYPMPGTISVVQDTKALTGTGTEFLKYLSPEDEVFVTQDDGTTVKISIESITTNLAAVLGDESDFNITNKPAIVKPKSPFRFKNRRWHLAGHKLRSPESTILYPTTSRRFVMDDVDDFEADDIVQINGSDVKIRRLSFNNMILASSLFPVPQSGDLVKKNPVRRVYLGSKELVSGRDWTLTNTTEAIIEIDELAEFNIANARNVGVNLTFTNGSREITTTATVDLRTIIKTNDWIKKNTTVDYFEILQVLEQKIILRTPFTGTTQTTTGSFKSVEVLGDDAMITCDCIGGESMDGSTWITTASDAVKHLVQYDAGFTEVDEEAFTQAKDDCGWMISVVIPESIGDQSPKIRDVITNINDSVFGSLYGNRTQAISFSILNARKPSELNIIRDDDVVSWRSTTEQKIINKVKINYQPFTDIFTGQSGFEVQEYDSEFVNNFIGIQNTDERTAYIYNKQDAEILAQRVAFFNSLSTCKISISAKLSMALNVVNDKIYIEFDRLFKRYGGKDKKKIAIITGIKKDGFNVEVDATDLGNIFNRVPAIAPDTTPSYDAENRDDATRYGFIVDNETETPDTNSEIDLGNNKIG